MKKFHLKSQFSCKSLLNWDFNGIFFTKIKCSLKIVIPTARYCMWKWIRVLWIRSGDAKGFKTNIQLYFGILVGKITNFESSKKGVFWNSASRRAFTGGHLMRKSTGKISQRVENHFINLYHAVKITSERCRGEFLIFSNFNFSLFQNGLPNDVKYPWFWLIYAILWSKIQFCSPKCQMQVFWD